MVQNSTTLEYYGTDMPVSITASSGAYQSSGSNVVTWDADNWTYDSPVILDNEISEDPGGDLENLDDIYDFIFDEEDPFDF